MCEHLELEHPRVDVMPDDKDKRRRSKAYPYHLSAVATALAKTRMAWHERRLPGLGLPGSFTTITPVVAPGPPRPFPYRSLCFITASLAFAFGLIVGVMIPLCLLPRNAEAEASVLPVRNFSRTSARPIVGFNATNYINQVRTSSDTLDESERRQWRVTPNSSRSESTTPSTRFPSVSFVAQPASQPAGSGSGGSLSLPPALPPLPIPFNGSVAAMLRGVAAAADSAAAAPLPPTSPSEDDTPGTLRGGIYWSRSVEDALPKGFSDAEVEAWRRFTRTTPVVKMEEGCGRMQNRLLTFLDGTTSCCRYRQNTDQIQGELFSFLLGRLLGLRNLAPSALSVVRPRDPRWSQVREHVAVAEWAEDKPVVMTKFVSALQPAHIPKALRGSNRRLHPPDVSQEAGGLSELAQWSDLVIFDYLTANLDRVVNNLYNQQWNKGMMDAPAHNLARDPATGLLVFLDNESGLLHGYRLLRKYESYHRLLLDQLCVFRKPTVDALRRLHKVGDVGDRLHEAFLQAEPHGGDILPGLPLHNVKVLNERIARVLGQEKENL